MDNRPFALSMSRHCSPEFAVLLASVISRHSDVNVQYRLISTIASSSRMALGCQTRESAEMSYMITERLFNEATPQSIAVQDDGHWAIVVMAAHTSLMAIGSPMVANEIHAVLIPIVLESLPQNRHERQELAARLHSAYVQMREISYRWSTAVAGHRAVLRMQ
jgi:hypothetical protein